MGGRSVQQSQQAATDGQRVAKLGLEAACRDGARQLGKEWAHGSGEWIKSRPARPGQQRPLAAWPHRGTAGGPCGTAQARDSRPCAAARAPGRLRGHGWGRGGGQVWEVSQRRGGAVGSGRVDLTSGNGGVVQFNWWRCSD